MVSQCEEEKMMKSKDAIVLIVVAIIAGLVVAYVTGVWKPFEEDEEA